MGNKRDSQIENDAMVMFAKLVNIATRKSDGHNHDVRVVMSEWIEPRTVGSFIRHSFLSGVVDNVRELGAKLGVGSQTILHRCIVFAPKDDTIAAMLRQAADLQEREEREKKYEYAEMYSNGDVGHEKGDSIDDVNHFLSDGSIIVRREVGEWEEVE